MDDDLKFISWIGGVLVVVMVIAFGILGLQINSREQKISSGEWMQLDVFVCSSEPNPEDSKSWPKVEDWVRHARILLTKQGNCVPVTAIVETAVFRNGDFRTLTIRWTIDSYDTDYGEIQEATAHVFIDTLKDKDVDAVQESQDTWTGFPNTDSAKRFIGQTFEISISGSEIYPQLCQRGIIHMCPYS